MEHDPKPGLDEADLDRLFAEARVDTPLPPSDLLARIEADAIRFQPPPPPLVATPVPRSARGAWLLDLIGRVALPSGVVAAGLTGLWIGLSAGGVVGADSFGASTLSLYDSELGMQMVYEFPVLAGLWPEG